MVSAKPARRATYADLEALPVGTTGEILDGELFAQPRPSAKHAQASSIAGVLLGGPFALGRGGPGGWILLDEPELHLGHGPDVLVPDMAGWRLTRLSAVPDSAAITLAPDWILEVLSPSTALIDRARKLPIYAREAVGHVWLIDPSLRSLEVFRLDRGAWRLLAVHSGSERARAEPFEAIELELGLLWGDVG